MLGDPLADFDRYSAEEERELDKRPKCSDCGEPIQDEKFYLINDEFICLTCMEDNYLCWTEDYIDLN